MIKGQAIIAILVENNAGVLARIAMLFGRRGYNIDSLTVSETRDKAISRITVTTRGDEQIIRQIMLQTEKLEEVKAVRLESDETILRELLLLKLAAGAAERSAIREVCDVYKATIVDLCPDSMIIELTGKPQKINAFLEVTACFETLELCRTGVTAMDRGDYVIPYEAGSCLDQPAL